MCVFFFIFLESHAHFKFGLHDTLNPSFHVGLVFESSETLDHHAIGFVFIS